MKKIIAVVCVVALGLVVLVVSVLSTDNDCEPATQSDPGRTVSGDYAYPTDKAATTVTSPFGYRDFGGGEFHNGIDLAGPAGTPLYAFADGRVVAAADSGVQGFGGWVVLDHTIEGRQIQTVYGHIEPGHVYVQVGQRISKGDHIADIGNAGRSTGPHVHFEVVEGDRAAGGQQVDPQPWLDKADQGGSAASETPSEPATVADEVGIAGLDGRQTALAKQIVAVGEAMGVDEKGRIIAVATAKHESQLRNYANDGSGAYQSAGASGTPPEELRRSLDFPHDAVGHDHASVGTFQQQVGIWGTVDELMNPAVQARKFYEALRKIDYASMSVGVAASTVQGNATGTGVYQAEEGVATELVKHFAGAGKDLSPEEIEALGQGAVSPSAPADAACTDADDSDSDAGGGAISSDMGQAIVDYARRESGLPYVWGGGDQNGPTGGLDGGEAGFDCSGLVIRAVAQATEGKVILPHYTVSQIDDPHTQEVSWEERQPGDLVFVGSPGQEHHVAIYSGQKDGKDMWVEAQTFGVPVGEYPVRLDERITVQRVVI